MQKRISTLVGTAIIIGAAVILMGGTFAYQYFSTKTQFVIQGPQSVNRADQTAGWKTYTDNNNGFEIKYPTDFANNVNDLTKEQQSLLATYMGVCILGNNARLLANEAGFCYIGKQTADGFAGASLNIVSAKFSTLQDCEKSKQFGPNGESAPTKQVILNGITFYKSQISEAGLGHYISTDSYRAYNEGTCYTIDLNIESDLGISGKGLSTDFFSMMSSKLESILSTFKFIASNTQTAINVFSPKDGDVVHVGQITEVSWWHYNPKNGDSAIFDISEINSAGQKVIASVVPSQIECNGHGAAACTYKWTPTQAFQQNKILVSERGADRIGYSGTFSVITPALIKPSITNINPTQAGSNSIITINGDNLSDAVAVVFYQNGQLRASAPASYILSDNQYQLTFNTDSFRVHSGTYQVEVYTAAGYSNSVNFTISTAY